MGRKTQKSRGAEEWANQIITELRNLALKSGGEQNEEKQTNL